MTKNDKKLYEKAMDKFNEGEIDNALQICEQCIAEDLKNAAALNLKGLILYLQGKAQEAKTTWETNKEYNNDEVAKNYLKSLDSDLPRLEKYEDAVKKIENFDISEGIKELEELTDSDFNAINISNALTYAYIKKGEFAKALEYNKKALGYDKANKLAIENYKEISTYYDVGDLKIDVKLNKNYKIIGGVAAIAIAGVISVFAYNAVSKNISPNADNNYVVENSQEESQQEEENDKNKSNVEKEVLGKKLNVEAVKNAKAEENYKKLADELKGIDESKLSDEEAKLVKECKELLGREGMESFYGQGRKLYKAGDYKNAEEELQYAYTYSEGSYLRPHTIYYLAANAEKSDNTDEAIKYYKQYVEEYSDVEYAAECAYKVAILSKDKNKSQSEKYANLVKDKYSSSMYYNSNIKEILGIE